MRAPAGRRHRFRFEQWEALARAHLGKRWRHLARPFYRLALECQRFAVRYISADQLATLWGVTRQWAQRIVRALESLGLVDCWRTVGGRLRDRMGRANGYQLTELGTAVWLEPARWPVPDGGGYQPPQDVRGRFSPAATYDAVEEERPQGVGLPGGGTGAGGSPGGSYSLPTGQLSANSTGTKPHVLASSNGVPLPGEGVNAGKGELDATAVGADCAALVQLPASHAGVHMVTGACRALHGAATAAPQPGREATPENGPYAPAPALVARLRPLRAELPVYPSPLTPDQRRRLLQAIPGATRAQRAAMTTAQTRAWVGRCLSSVGYALGMSWAPPDVCARVLDAVMSTNAVHPTRLAVHRVLEYATHQRRRVAAALPPPPPPPTEHVNLATNAAQAGRIAAWLKKGRQP